MKAQLINLFKEVANGLITPDEAYYKFIDMKQDLYSVLAKENGLVEVAPNKWVKEFEATNKESMFDKWWYLSKDGFHLHIEKKKKQKSNFFNW